MNKPQIHESRPGFYRSGAPTEIQRASSARSSSVIPVLLASGMVLVSTARTRMRSASRAMLARTAWNGGAESAAAVVAGAAAPLGVDKNIAAANANPAGTSAHRLDD